MKCGKSFFYKARSKNIKLIKYTQRRMCVCIKHANMSLVSAGSKVLPSSTREIASMSDEDVRRSLDRIPEDSIVRFQLWEKTTVVIEGKNVKKDRLVDKDLPKDEFVSLVLDMLPEFRDHSSRVEIQYNAVTHLKSILQPNIECTVQMDFSEIWAAQFMNEPSSVYYDKYQTTLHPMVVHYRDHHEEIKVKSFVGVSEERSHGAATIYSFIAALIHKLRRTLPQLERVHFITDSPTSQYRNRTIISLLGLFPALFNMTATWTWLECGHGKGPCDGLGGSMKQKADNLVKNGEAIRTAEEFASKIQKAGVNADIIYLSKDVVTEKKNEISWWKVEAIPGLMKTHAAVPAQGHIYTRNVSCFNTCCFSEGKFRLECDGWSKTKAKVSRDIILAEDREDNEEPIESQPLVADYESECESDSEESEEESSKEEETEEEQSEASLEHQIEEDEVNENGNNSSKDQMEAVNAEGDGEIEGTEIMGGDTRKEMEEVHDSSQMDAVNEEGDEETQGTEIVEGATGKVTEENQEKETDEELKPKAGGYVVVMYGKKWYIGKILSVHESSMEVTYMKKCRGKFKWGQTDTGVIDMDEVIAYVKEPQQEGNLWDLSQDDKDLIALKMK